MREHIGPLGDVLGIVADPFQAARDLDDGQHDAQIGGVRRAQGDQPGRFLVHLRLERVHRAVAAAHILGQLVVARFERGGRVHNGGLNQTAHLDDKRLNSFKIPVKGRSDMAVRGRHGCFPQVVAAQPMRPLM